jgi:hypothetical protein
MGHTSPSKKVKTSMDSQSLAETAGSYPDFGWVKIKCPRVFWKALIRPAEGRITPFLRKPLPPFSGGSLGTSSVPLGVIKKEGTIAPKGNMSKGENFVKKILG